MSGGELFVVGLSWRTAKVDVREKLAFREDELPETPLAMTQKLTAEATLTNEGSFEGANIVQLYIADPYASIARPVKELKGFQKITLKPGESRVVRFEVSEDQLKFINADLKEVVENGRFDVQIGLDSHDVQVQSFELV